MSLPTRTKQLSFWQQALVMVDGVLVLIGLQIGELDQIFRDRVFWTLQPGYQLAQAINNWFVKTQSVWTIYKEGGSRLVYLEKQNLQLRQQIVNQEVLRQENEQLRQQLGLEPSGNYQVKHLYGFDQNWFINGGTNHNVLPGDIITADGILVGLVTESGGRASRLKTIVDQDWQIPVKIQPLGVWGLFSNAKGYSEVLYVSKTTELQVGQTVVTAGDEDLPPNIAIGTIGQLEVNNDGTTWRVIIDPLVKINEINYVEVRPGQLNR